jgi:hypothetical protein
MICTLICKWSAWRSIRNILAMFCGFGCSEIQQTRQLIGVGVRLGKTPQIHDAEGNSKEKVVYRGSGLRIRTDEGELANFASVYFT